MARWTSVTTATRVINGSLSYFSYGPANDGALTNGSDFYVQRAGLTGSNPVYGCGSGQCDFLNGWDGSPNADNYIQCVAFSC